MENTNDIDLKQIRIAAGQLSRSSEAERNAFLKALAVEIQKDKKAILAANRADIQAARAKGLEQAFVERLVLDEKEFKLLRAKVASITRLKSGLHEVMEKKKRKDGLLLTKVRVPLGVLMVIYEARPEVTVDVASLCIKSGNAAVLKGGSEALNTNRALFACIRSALRKTGFSEYAVSLIESEDRAVTNALLKRHDAIDLVIARGSYGMVQAVMSESKIPVLAHAAGGARIYVDKSADLTMAEKVLINSKITKPAACNSLDTILVDSAIVRTFIPRIKKKMEEKGVNVLISTDWDKETLSLEVGIKTVSGIDEALTFIQEHTKHHTEGILAKDMKVVQKFLRGVDAAALFVNAATRIHDGYQFELGSEMGISTSRLHARGPVGLRELTTYTWHVYGKGHIRK